MMKSTLRRSLLTSCLALGAGLSLVAVNGASAADVAASVNDSEPPEVEAVRVFAPVGQAADVAPVKSSLKADQPQAVITRKFIEEATPRVGDFTTTAMLAPSMGGVPNANGPGATDGAKITMRGFADGEYNITYDGISWGDTNGPSHHANSFFPNSTIGGVVIERGPGSAPDLGQASFGGSLNLFSLPFEDKQTFRQTLTAGSFGTVQGVTTLATGPVKALHDANFVANFMEYKTDGYLTNSASEGQNQFFKATVPLTSKWSATFLFTRNDDNYYQGDASSAATVAQTEAFGKRFALSNDPTLQTYKGYNYTKKQTDFEYLRLNGDLGAGLTVENTLYSYWYTNKTLSANNNGADSTLGAVALAAANKVILSPAATYPVGGSGYSSTLKVNGLPGYLKRNEYRVAGDELKFVKEFSAGTLTFGGMYELAKTKRYRFDIDLLTRQPDYREKAATFTGPTGCDGLPVQTTAGKTWTGACQVPLNIAYNEYSGWHQYQGFAQFEWRPLPNLTITPGVKHVNFELYVHAPAVATKNSIQPLNVSHTYEKTLPYLTANYRVQPNMAVYAQFAQGFLVPNISAYYVNNPSAKAIVPQESTNYQTGVVWNAGKFTLDADIYYIDFKNKIQNITDTTVGSPTFGETYETNTGGAIYRGVEGQATYVLDYGFSVFGNASYNQAHAGKDVLSPGGNGHQLAKAPLWTGAWGLRYGHKNLLSGNDELVSNLTTKMVGPQDMNAASGSAVPNGHIKAFANTDFTTTYRIGQFSLEAQVINLGDRTSIVSAKGSALKAGTSQLARTVADGGAANTFVYQAGRSYQLTLKMAF